MIKNIIGLAGLTAGALLVSACARTAQDAPFTAQHEERVEEIVRAYLLQNPEILTEAMQALRERQTAEEAARVAQALQEHRDELLADPMSPVGGNPEGTVTMVEFFDYNCAYCRRAGPVLAEMLKGNPDVRLVYKEFPTLAPSSRFAARAALAARHQSPELYTAFHNALMGAEGPLTAEAVVQIAGEVGVGVERMRADMEDPTIEESVKRNIELARAIGATGTPTFVVGDAMLVGFKPLAQMERAIADARSAPTSRGSHQVPAAAEHGAAEAYPDR
ncbi:MAG: DsbA family protein [Gammaproteobacteria bacterium]